MDRPSTELVAGGHNGRAPLQTHCKDSIRFCARHRARRVSSREPGSLSCPMAGLFPICSSPAGTMAVPPFKPTVKIVFVSAPDTELGEFLRANRAHSVAQWQDYIGRYPKATHIDLAKQALATLLLKEGADGLASYRSRSEERRVGK